MSANCSNASFLPPGSLEKPHNVLQECFSSAHGKFSLAAYTIANTLVLLPLYNYTLYLGLQRWRRQQSSAPISHSDAFTYHMILIELVCFSGSVLVLFGANSVNLKMMSVGFLLVLFNLSGENAFHLITCGERYLAVAFPIVYLSLRNEKGTKIRNVAISCAWLLCFACAGVLYLENGLIIYFSLTAIILVTLSFCSINVLYVLSRSQPVDSGGHRQHVDRSKLGAFYTITLIIVAMILRSVGFVVTPFVVVFHDTGIPKRCLLLMAAFWLSLPSNLVLPLLYLHRAGKLPGFKCKTQSG